MYCSDTIQATAALADLSISQMDEKTERRVCVKFCFKTGKSALETHELIKTTSVFIWFNRFKDDHESKMTPSGRHSTSKINENMRKFAI
ncbi:hypothetical protein ANN_03976 [Periplaneta americana]|uniref:Mos1 transposase HTH domain-containing protein n=1 Tax=Periplaneta americana TaxID=6978 RepID=A0ABQ8T7A5_PERAM|nr:hypothetical protein ANN_03976 [Periplaneta americana]